MLSVMAVRSRGKDGLGRGLLVLWIGHGVNLTHPSDTKARNNARLYFSLFPVLPIRVVGIHACYDDELMTSVLTSAMTVANPEHVVRFQSHLGSLAACLQSLRRYGLPKEILPLDEQGNLEVSDFREMVQSYQSELDDGGDNHQEAASPNRNVFPTVNDILLGKGKRSDKFPGNYLFRKAIAENYDGYNASSDRGGKLATLQLIYFQLLQSGCRFLAPVQKDGNGNTNEWMVIPEEDALAKISMGIRNFRRKGSSSGR
jgi:hypothetical protein